MFSEEHASDTAEVNLFFIFKSNVTFSIHICELCDVNETNLNQIQGLNKGECGQKVCQM